MNYIKGELSGVWIIEPRRITDSRGYFCETFRADEFRRIVGPVDFVQENESESVHGVIRGLHYQAGAASQAKLVSVCSGSIVDVAVIKLDSDSGCRLYIPRGFAHGFAVLSERARFQYKVDNYYCPLSERTIRVDDPDLSIDWPLSAAEMILSDKDRNGTPFSSAELFD